MASRYFPESVSYRAIGHSILSPLFTLAKCSCNHVDHGGKGCALLCARLPYSIEIFGQQQFNVGKHTCQLQHRLQESIRTVPTD